MVGKNNRWFINDCKMKYSVAVEGGSTGKDFYFFKALGWKQQTTEICFSGKSILNLFQQLLKPLKPILTDDTFP